MAEVGNLCSWSLLPRPHVCPLFPSSSSVTFAYVVKTSGDVLDSVRFAVRSSALGEDSAELSAAGQNETVLGCARDIDSLCKALARCWASLYAYQSVEYRRYVREQRRNDKKALPKLVPAGLIHL